MLAAPLLQTILVNIVLDGAATAQDEAPATGFKRVLKPLFEIAIRRAVEKVIEEDRLDLEERGYGRSS